MQRWTWIVGFLGMLGVVAFLAYAGLVDAIETPYAIAGGAAVAMVLIWIAADWQELSRFARARGTRYSFNATVLVIVVGAIAVALNVLAQRYDKRFDLTASKRFELSEQTVRILRGLEEDVRILAFFPTGSIEEGDLRDLTDGYLGHTDRLSVSFHDPVREPLVAEQHDVRSTWGTVVLLSGDRTQRLETEFGEEALTNAIIRVVSDERHQVCATTGHGELDPDDSSGASGLGLAAGRLTAQNYELRKLTLVREGAVPADCDLLVIADPQSDWLAPEREMVAAWVAGGGAVLVMLDPTHAPGLAADLARYGLELGDDVVLEANPRYQLVGGDATWIVLDPASFSAHDLLGDLQGMSIMRLARSVSPGAPVPGVDVQVLARTTEYGWAETTLDGLTEPAPGDGDIVGSVPLIALAEVSDPAALQVGATAVGAGGGSALPVLPGAGEGAGEGEGATGEAAADETATPPAANEAAADALTELPRAPGGRVLVFGDADFASNELLGQGSNQDLFLNAVAWLVGEEDQVSIRPNPASTGSFTMSFLQGLLVWLLCLLVVPGAAIAMAIGTWRRRRAL